jgi:hypothetical protein
MARLAGAELRSLRADAYRAELAGLRAAAAATTTPW